MRRFFIGLTFSLAAGALPAVAAADNVEFSQSIATALRDSGRLVDYSIGVVSEDGVVQLDGRVANKEQQAQAKTKGKAAGRGEGVRPTSMDESSAPELNSPAGAASSSGNSNDLVSKLRAGRNSSAASAAAKKAGAQSSQRQHSQQMSPQQQAMAQQMAMQQSMQAGMQGMPPGMQGMPQGQKGMPRPLPPGQAQQAMMAGRPVQQMGMNPANCPPGGMAGAAMGMGAGAAGMAVGAAGAAMGMGGGGMGGPMPMNTPTSPGGVRPAGYDQPYMPNHAWPSYAAYPNYAAVTYPRQYSPTAWPYIGPFYPYPQVPLGWRKVTLEWDDGWWMLNFKD
jgi:hypothetical protein